MPSKYMTVIIAFFAVDIIFLIYILISHFKTKKRQNRVNHFGDSAEVKVTSFIKKYIPHYAVMHDIYLKTETGLTQIDHLLITKNGIFIIETKSHNGYIDTSGKHWTQRYKDKVIRFHNPVYQNKVHKTAFLDILKKRQSLASLPVYTVVVFTSSNVTFSENVKDVVRLNTLPKFILNKPRVKRMDKSLAQSIVKLVEMNMETSSFKKNRHKNKIYKNNAKKRLYRVNAISNSNATSK